MKLKLTLILTLVASVSLAQAHKHVDSLTFKGAKEIKITKAKFVNAVKVQISYNDFYKQSSKYDKIYYKLYNEIRWAVLNQNLNVAQFYLDSAKKIARKEDSLCSIWLTYGSPLHQR